MGQGNSKLLFVQVLKTMLHSRGTKVSSSQLQNFLQFVEEVCPWFPEEGTVSVETWTKVGERIQEYYRVHGPEKVPVDAFALWTLIRDCLVHDSEAEQWRRLRGSLRRTCSVPSLGSLPPIPATSKDMLQGAGGGTLDYEIADEDKKPGCLAAVAQTPETAEAIKKVCSTQTYQTFLEALEQVPPVYPNLRKDLDPQDWENLEEQAARYHCDDEVLAGAALHKPSTVVPLLTQLREELQAIADTVRGL